MEILHAHSAEVENTVFDNRWREYTQYDSLQKSLNASSRNWMLIDIFRVVNTDQRTF